MSDNQKESTPEPKLAVDWSSDYFPTSARHVFLGWGAMVVGIIVLCFVAYSTSEHPVDDTKTKKQEASRARVLDLQVSEED